MTPQARSNLKFPEKAAARRAVRAAIVAGLLKRPDACSKCGSVDTKCSDGRSRIQAHHANGYEEKLNVIWLCPACHALEDAQASGDQNGRARITWAGLIIGHMGWLAP